MWKGIILFGWVTKRFVVSGTRRKRLAVNLFVEVVENAQLKARLYCDAIQMFGDQWGTNTADAIIVAVMREGHIGIIHEHAVIHLADTNILDCLLSAFSIFFNSDVIQMPVIQVPRCFRKIDEAKLKIRGKEIIVSDGYEKLLKIAHKIACDSPGFHPFVLNVFEIQNQTILSFRCVTNPLALNEETDINRIGGFVIDGLVSNTFKLKVNGLRFYAVPVNHHTHVPR